jgi:putative hydrolase of the HAD superfamily
MGSPQNNPTVSMTITTIAFDGDDTLWHHENFFLDAQKRLHALLNEYGDFPDAFAQIDAQHVADLPIWGYGVKSLVLSALECAIRITAGKIPAEGIQRILEIGRELHQHPVQLLDGVAEAVGTLNQRYGMILITKGDLIAQEMKVTRSGIAPYFDAVEIVSEKNEETYERIFKRYQLDPAEVLMIGNSIKSDILPVVRVGGQAIHIPYHTTWEFEKAEIAQTDLEKFIVLPTMKDLPEFLERLEKSGQSKLSALVERV